MNFDIDEFIKKAEMECEKEFLEIDEIALLNQQKVLNAFIKNRVSPQHFHPSNGYGYDDMARDTLNKLFADVFGTEDAIVSPLIANGTHALSLALFGLLRPDDTMLSISGKPYDTLDEVINGENIGSLKDFNIKYHQIDYINNNFDTDCILRYIKENKVKVVFIQRSKGYEWQNSIPLREIEDIVSKIKAISIDSIIVVDNCYGEFCEEIEPSNMGADVVVGSLIKNPGGGIAPTGGYIVGNGRYIDLIARRLTAPSLGKEVGSYNASYLPFIKVCFWRLQQ